MKWNRSGLAACAVYMVAIVWLIAKRYSGTQSPAIDAAEFYLVTYPLSLLGVNIFGTEEFWTRYQLFFFPACFVVIYLAGCAIGWIMYFDKFGSGKQPGKP